MIEEFNENVHFVEIDIEEDPEIAEAAGIMGTPCVQFFKNKEMIRLVKLGSPCSVYKENQREFCLHEIPLWSIDNGNACTV